MTLDMSPSNLVIHLSQGKARDVAARHTDALVLGADTIIFYKNERLGKPHTKERAIEMLKMLSGREHSAITGYTLINTKEGKTISKAVETKVFFKNLTDKEIEDYVATGEPLNKAGAYGILENGRQLIEKNEGSKNNVAGLPIEDLIETRCTF
jgi:septum formation protein